MDFLKSLLEPGTIVGIIGAAIGAVIGLWGLWVSYKAKRTQVLEYEIVSTQILTNGANNIPGLQISVGDKFVSSNLTSSEIEFYNHGNTTINQRDFPSKAQLRVITSGHFFNIEAIDADLIKSNNSALNPGINIIDDGTLEISFEYLKPKQKFSLSVLHDGEICVKGDLRSGKIRQQQDAPSEEISPKRHAGGSLRLANLCTVVSVILVVPLTLISIHFANYSLGERSSSTFQIEQIQNECDQLKLQAETMQLENDRLRQENYELKDENLNLKAQLYEMQHYIEYLKREE